MIQTPYVGQIVLYQSLGSTGGEYLPEARAAIITEVPGRTDDTPPDTVGLCVFNPEGWFLKRGVLYAPEPNPGHWHLLPE